MGALQRFCTLKSDSHTSVAVGPVAMSPDAVQLALPATNDAETTAPVGATTQV